MMKSPVNSHNEWDPLEEVVVGRLEGAVMPPNQPGLRRSIPPTLGMLLPLIGGWPYPPFLTRAAQRDLDEFVSLLESEGITVRRPEIVQGRRKFRTPLWSSRGFATACPRDGFLVLGDEILETPMSWRCRHFEGLAYRPLFRSYARAGARWTAAPRPALSDALFNPSYRVPRVGPPTEYALTEHEPVFDAADFVRCGRDLFGIRSNVTNLSGIEWLRRHLGDRYRIHLVESRCNRPMHIDATLVPLAPGRMMIHPEQVDPERLPRALKGWEILIPPPPEPLPGPFLSMCSAWLSLNVLSLDPTRVVVERSQVSLIRALKEWGFEPIPCSFRNYAPFGGSFHCATLDIRRRGGLQSYCEAP